jgi:Fur family ferric uptake transcriptional regulator
MRDRGFRVTPQRQLILDAICAGGGHTTLEEIYARVHCQAPAVNRATVYRTLDFLLKLRLVVAADLGGGRTVYEIAGEVPHHHLVCRACGACQELPHTAVQRLMARVARDQSFQIDMDHITLFGLCAECQAAARPAPGARRPRRAKTPAAGKGA